MNILIRNLYEPSLDKFINQDSDRYAHIDRYADDTDDTLDLYINMRTIAVDENHIIIEYPNGNTTVIEISEDDYSKIEVL